MPHGVIVTDRKPSEKRVRTIIAHRQMKQKKEPDHSTQADEAGEDDIFIPEKSFILEETVQEEAEECEPRYTIKECVQDPKYIVFDSKLKELFNVCLEPGCRAGVISSSLKISGFAITMETVCCRPQEEVGVPDQCGKVVCRESVDAVSGLPYWRLPLHFCGNMSPPQPGVHVTVTVRKPTEHLHCARGTAMGEGINTPLVVLCHDCWWECPGAKRKVDH
ncbi:unnamed protein product [Coregonus sp. 'balchen']|nr:unnamed protein product [Coregonus sp. 'balchen']